MNSKGRQPESTSGNDLGDGPRDANAAPRAYQRCTNCVMDTTDPGITFDKEGKCHHCRAFYNEILPNWHPNERGKRELRRLGRSIKEKGQGKEFDCIIGISGGADSSYLTYVATEILGLRPLLFHVDAGWNTQIAVNNIERLVSKLGLDLFTEVIDWEEMRDLQLAFFKSGVPHIDFPQDHAFFATMYKFASKHKIRHILTGGNYSTECVNNPVAWVYYPSDSTQLRDIHRRFGTRPLTTFPMTSVLWHKVYLPYVRKIRVERPLNLIPYVKKDAMQFLTERFGWQPYPQKHFESRFTKFFEGYWLPARFGYDTRKNHFSSFILTGQMERSAALEALREPPLDADTVRREKEYMASKLEITLDELQGYFELPKKTYKDYRNQAWVYSLGSPLARLLGLEGSSRR